MLTGVMRLPGCPFDSVWCLVCELCRLTVDWVDSRCPLSFVFLGGARRLQLSPCHTRITALQSAHTQHAACGSCGLTSDRQCEIRFRTLRCDLFKCLVMVKNASNLAGFTHICMCHIVLPFAAMRGLCCFLCVTPEIEVQRCTAVICSWCKRAHVSL